MIDKFSFSGNDLSNKIDVLVAIQPVISDGRLAPVLAQEWKHPLIFFATPEEQTGMMISGNSLVKYCASFFYSFMALSQILTFVVRKINSK